MPKTTFELPLYLLALLPVIIFHIELPLQKFIALQQIRLSQDLHVPLVLAIQFSRFLSAHIASQHNTSVSISPLVGPRWFENNSQ